MHAPSSVRLRPFLACLLLLAAVGCAPQVSLTPKPTGKYVNDHLGIRFEVPNERREGDVEDKYWEIRESVGPAVVVALSRATGAGDHFRENLVVMKVDSDGADAVGLRDRELEQARATPGFSPVGQGEDGPCPWLEFTHAAEGGDVHVLTFFQVRSAEGYILTFTAQPERFADYRRSFEGIAGSFKFFEPGTAPAEAAPSPSPSPSPQ